MESKGFNLDQTTIKKLLTIYKLKIPDFQRNFVWKLSKKQQLLESLFRGFPIGAITLYEDENVYYIIDGLQRINTLNQYLSRPSSVISASKFCEAVKTELEAFLLNKGLKKDEAWIKKSVKSWYEKLNGLYEFEKVSLLYHILKEEGKKNARNIGDLQTVEELLEILVGKIQILNDDIALIIYRGDKNDLPELFKNINTGSVALSQYEILQSVWNDYLLDKDQFSDTYAAFNRELELIKDDYEINAFREHGKFDIFKNIVGLNQMICCKKDCDTIFKFSVFKKLAKPLKMKEDVIKYYENDGIAFELYSTILCKSSNQIVKTVDLIYKHYDDKEKVNSFVKSLNNIIMEAIDTAITEVKKANNEMIESKYHSLYVLIGIIFSKYDIDEENLNIKEIVFNESIFREALDLKKHKDNNWFVDENRQMGFFKIKINEMLDLQRISQENNQDVEKEKMEKNGILELYVNGEKISAYTVKDFYRNIFNYIIEHNISFDEFVPYATGKKRYLINRTNRHINNSIFVSPICIKEYYIETHKSKIGATRDIYNFLKTIGVEVHYV